MAASSSTAASRKKLEKEITALGPWFHNLLLDGVQTAPHHFLGDYPAVKFARFYDVLPADLSGKTVLDIGCNAGFYSLEMKRRGADYVLGVDTDERYLRQARFAARLSELDIEYQQLSVWQIASLKMKFDLVIFMGVLYHLRHPLLALDLIHEHVACDLFLFQSMQRGSVEIEDISPDYDISEVSIFNRPGYPKLHFVEDSYSHDRTNWWVPNRACVEAMLRSSGFSIEAQPEEEVYVCHWRPLEDGSLESHCVYPDGNPQ